MPLVGGVGVEGRVEVDQVHRLGGDVVAEDLEVVAVEEGVRHGVLGVVGSVLGMGSLSGRVFTHD